MQIIRLVPLSLRSFFMIFLFCLMTAIVSPAQTLTTLASFDGTNGADPLYMSIVQGPDGDIYGTTFSGGKNANGTVFKITPTGTLTTLYSFCTQSGCPDGRSPEAGLILGIDGNFYGTTAFGGTNNDGTIFKVTLGGKLTTLHSFDSNDGSRPVGALVQASNGNFYGTAEGGGNQSCPGGCGTVFKISPEGMLTTLYNFCALSNCPDGEFPSGALVQATNGNFYGTTGGGANGDWGTVFEIAPNGKLTTLYSFCAQANCVDGYFPNALVQGADGNFYGTTERGGTENSGTVFKITPGGSLTTLYNFCSFPFCPDGANPYSGLVQATDGNFYGTTSAGGVTGDSGTAFKITPTGALTQLASFFGLAGIAPMGGLVQSTNGIFYGTTSSGGTDGFGTVFSLATGLGPFVETLPTSGKVGMTVGILGTNLTGTTSVSFNGTAATFNVVSKALIKATVPAGATTGNVEATTPGGVLISNKLFVVRQ